jgi:hypothetical protein
MAAAVDTVEGTAYAEMADSAYRVFMDQIHKPLPSCVLPPLAIVFLIVTSFFFFELTKKKKKKKKKKKRVACVWQ